MQVNFYATFRLRAGVKSLVLDLPAGTTMQQAVHAIVEHIPALKPDWISKSGEIYPHVHGFVNGVDVATLPAGWDTQLQSTDTLDFLPPVAGG
jgi:molybdopterin converting factor small subunit